MQTKTYRIHYSGSKFWMIFWLLIFFPIGLVLLATHMRVVSHHKEIHFEYQGARFWLYFWALFFFPIMLFLLVFNGSIVKHASH